MRISERADEDCERARNESTQWKIGAHVLHSQLRGEGIDPHWNIPANGDPPHSDDLTALLVRYFNMEELEALSYEVGIQWESLGGEGLPVRALRLVEYSRRRGLINPLREAIKRARPNASL